GRSHPRHHDGGCAPKPPLRAVTRGGRLRHRLEGSNVRRDVQGRVFSALLALSALTIGGCPLTPYNSPPEKAEGWDQRAQRARLEADFQEAHDSAEKALAIVPEDPQVRVLAAHVALTSLDYAEVLRLLKGIKSTEASALRGRAFWYKGELEAAADELDA